MTVFVKIPSWDSTLNHPIPFCHVYLRYILYYSGSWIWVSRSLSFFIFWIQIFVGVSDMCHVGRRLSSGIWWRAVWSKFSSFWGNRLPPSSGWSSDQTIKRYIPEDRIIHVSGAKTSNLTSSCSLQHVRITSHPPWCNCSRSVMMFLLNFKCNKSLIVTSGFSRNCVIVLP